jgi:FKBP-type peptidyl-prolyl cis-trans isomerase 2
MSGESGQLGNADESSVVQEGDFIVIDYIGRINDETKRVFALTREEDAKRERLYKEDGVYQPQLCAVGKGMVVPGLDKALVGMKVGGTKTVEIEPAEAYGERDPRNIQPYPAPKLKKKGIQVQKGARVRVDGREGTIVMVGGGRVRVDFNRPLAGKPLVFDVTVREKLTDLDAKIRAVIKHVIPHISIEEFVLTHSDKAIDIEVPNYLLFVEGMSIVRVQIARDLNALLGFETVRIVDKFDWKQASTEGPITTEEVESGPMEDKPSKTSEEEE